MYGAWLDSLTHSAGLGPWRSLAAMTSCLHWGRSWAMFVHRHTCRTPSAVRSSRTLSSHLFLGLPRGRRPLGVPSMIRLVVRSSSMRATWPAQRSRMDFWTQDRGGRPVASRSSALCLQRSSPVMSSRMGPYILLHIDLSKTSSRLSSSLVSLHVSPPYSTMGLTITV